MHAFDRQMDRQTDRILIARSHLHCVKIDADDDNVTYIHPRLFKGRNTKVCMWGEVSNIIVLIKFDVDRLWGFRSLGF